MSETSRNSPQSADAQSLALPDVAPQERADDPQSSHEYEAQNSRTAPQPEMRGEEFDFPAARLAVSESTEAENGVKKRHWGWLLAGGLAFYSVYFFAWTQGYRSQKPLPLGPIQTQKSAPRWIKIFITGAVKKPGVYTLPATARVQDALQKAGGTLPKADAGALNLADWAVDGSKIEVPFKASPAPKIAAAPPEPEIVVAPTPTIIIKEVFITPPQNSPLAPVVAPSKSISKPNAPKVLAKTSAQNLAKLRRAPVDLNRATLGELERLPGVGPKMAERILAYRAENGAFKSVDDLDNVRGIGEKKLAVLKGLVRVK